MEQNDEPLFSTVQKGKQKPADGKNKALTYLIRGYFLALVAMMLGLYIYVLAVCIASRNPALIAQAAGCSIAVAGTSAIFIITAFNLWGKLLAKIFHKSPKEAELSPEIVREQQDELYIYKDSLRIVNKFGASVVPFHELEKTEYLRLGGEYSFIFHTKLNYRFCTLPVGKAPLNKIKKLLPCPVVTSARAEAEERKKERRQKGYKRKKQKGERPEWLNKDTLGGIFMGFFAIAAGTALVVLHYKVEERVPVFLGLFFIGGGLLALCAAVGHGSDWCNQVAVPLLFGITFTVFTVGFFPAMYIELDLNTVREVLISQPYVICFFGLTGVGLFLIIVAIANLIKLIRKK